MKQVGVIIVIICLTLTSCVSLGSSVEHYLNAQSTDLVSPIPTDAPTKKAQSTLVVKTQTNQPTDTTKIIRADLDDLGLAPELENEIWLNTERPLRLKNLRGKVVLIDMWTFG
jgi:hypothetical protein